MNIVVNYVVLSILAGFVLLNLQVKFYYNDTVGPIYPPISSFMDVILSAPYPLNSVVLVVIALGVSNVILRGLEFGSRPDMLLGILSFAAVAQFINEVFLRVTFAGNIFPYFEVGQWTEILNCLFGLAFLATLAYLSYLSHQYELGQSPGDNLELMAQLRYMRKRVDDLRTNGAVDGPRQHTRRKSNRN